MGGYGSGRWHYVNTRPVAEDGLILSMKPLKADIAFCAAYPGNMKRGGVTWSIRDHSVASIGYLLTSPHDLTLIYVHTWHDGRKQPIEQYVRLTRVPKHFGGHQTYFLCPKCSRRSAKLYSPPGSPYFRCRKCTGVTYRSCNESHKSDRVGRMIGIDLRRLERLMTLERRITEARSKRARDRANAALVKAQRGGLI